MPSSFQQYQLEAALCAYTIIDSPIKQFNIMNFKPLLFIVCLCMSLDAYAVDCNNPPGGIGPEAAQVNLQCAEQEHSAADRSLNETYKNLILSLKNNPDQRSFPKTQIVAAQRAWVAFRDAECDFRASLSGGAPQWLPVNRTQCLTELTTARVKVLQGYADEAQSQ
jgi:uncharacterized protein YecT (DUF1311 family)